MPATEAPANHALWDRHLSLMIAHFYLGCRHLLCEKTYMRSRSASATCPNCNTLFERLAVEYDEEGGCVALKVTPCTACRRLLCSACDCSECDGCGNVFCADCLQLVEDGTGSPLHCCQVCVQEGAEALPGPPQPACGATQTTAQDDPLYPGLEQPVCCETLPAVA